jgi:uncharacterized membrane protein YkvA (DUF1232 family)
MNETNGFDCPAKRTISESLMFIPNLIKLLYRLLESELVSATDKTLLMGTVLYVLSPWDFLPDVVPFIGQLDDILLIALVLNRLMSSVDHEILLQYWDGHEELLELLEKVLDKAVIFLPPGVYQKLIKKSQGQDFKNAEYI